MIKDLILNNRSYRRFKQEIPIKRETLIELIELARLSPSGSNLQPLKYILSNEPEKNSVIFEHLAWAGYLTDWEGPTKGEQPSAYIVILKDLEISRSFGCDHGIAGQSILLGAVEKGLGGCIIGSVKRSELNSALNIPQRYEIRIVIALGVPKEEVKLENVGPDGDIKYWRDNKGIHHVPKRALADIILDL